MKKKLMALYEPTYCSLPRLAEIIECYYNNNKIMFPNLTELDVKYIIQCILNCTYTFSPILVKSIPYKEGFLLRKNLYHNSRLIRINSNQYIEFSPKAGGDTLVLMALGMMINNNIIENNMLMENISFGFKTSLFEYYDYVATSRNIDRVYIYDLFSTLSIINRPKLLFKLSKMIKDDKILDLLSNFLYLDIIDEEGVYDGGMSIPPSGYLSEVLLNFYLIHLDNIFPKCFPEWNYTRYVNEVIVSLPTNYRWNSEDILFGGYDYNHFDDCMDKLFLNNKMKCGNILSIDQGGPAVPCSGGKLLLSLEGDILHIYE